MFGLLLNLLLKSFPFFALHIRGSGSFPRALTAKEEAELLARSCAGDQQARDTLVEHNLRLVAHLAKKYYAVAVDPEDLISIGTIGLIKAVNTFDQEKNIKLATYASRCIENEILMHFRQRKKYANEVSINEPIETDNEGNPLTLMDIISAEDTIADDLDRKLKLEQLRTYISEMDDPREKAVILLRYGLYGRQNHTQNQVAKQLGISRSYVSRIEKKALESLRARFEKR